MVKLVIIGPWNTRSLPCGPVALPDPSLLPIISALPVDHLEIIVANDNPAHTFQSLAPLFPFLDPVKCMISYNGSSSKTTVGPFPFLYFAPRLDSWQRLSMATFYGCGTILLRANRKDLARPGPLPTVFDAILARNAAKFDKTAYTGVWAPPMSPWKRFNEPNEQRCLKSTPKKMPAGNLRRYTAMHAPTEEIGTFLYRIRRTRDAAWFPVQQRWYRSKAKPRGLGRWRAAQGSNDGAGRIKRGRVGPENRASVKGRVY